MRIHSRVSFLFRRALFTVLSCVHRTWLLCGRSQSLSDVRDVRHKCNAVQQLASPPLAGGDVFLWIRARRAAASTYTLALNTGRKFVCVLRHFLSCVSCSLTAVSQAQGYSARVTLTCVRSLFPPSTASKHLLLRGCVVPWLLLLHVVLVTFALSASSFFSKCRQPAIEHASATVVLPEPGKKNQVLRVSFLFCCAWSSCVLLVDSDMGN